MYGYQSSNIENALLLGMYVRFIVSATGPT